MWETMAEMGLLNHQMIYNSWLSLSYLNVESRGKKQSEFELFIPKSKYDFIGINDGAILMFRIYNRRIYC